MKVKQEFILGIFIAIYILYFTTATFLRYDNFYTGRYDLGNMDQTVWNTINGRIFQTNNDNGEIINRLAVHSDIILVLLSPLYLVFEHAKTLLFIQTTILSIGVIFVYTIGKNVLKNKNLSLIFAFLYLLYPAVHFTNLYDFHGVTLATTFLLGTFYFLLKKRYLLFLLFAILAALTKEQIWVVVAIFGIYIFFFHKSKRIIGATVTLVSLAVFYFLIWHIMPSQRGSEHFALSFYSDFGQSPTDVVKNVFLSPQQTLSTFFQKDQLSYLSQLFLPLGFLSLLSPLHLVFALPDLFINLLSGNPKLHQIYYQYSAAITPFIIISAIYGARNLKTRFPKFPTTIIALYLILTTLYSSYAFGPLPFARKPNTDMFTKPQANKADIEKFLSAIPESYSIASTNNIGSHLSQREIVYTLPVGLDKADMVIFLLNDQSSKDFFKDDVRKISKNKNYREIYKIGDTFIAFERQVNS